MPQENRRSNWGVVYAVSTVSVQHAPGLRICGVVYAVLAVSVQHAA